VAQLFELPYKFIAPDVIVAELDDPPVQSLVSLGLQQYRFSGEQVAQVQSLVRKHRGSSPKDLFALVLAKELKGILLTGDRLLRKAAEAEGVTVHGTLWVLDTLITRGIILPREAAAALRRMLISGRRLPKQECQTRLKRWERGEDG
jgi:predicted nucleic acid-binding protein